MSRKREVKHFGKRKKFAHLSDEDDATFRHWAQEFRQGNYTFQDVGVHITDFKTNQVFTAETTIQWLKNNLPYIVSVTPAKVTAGVECTVTVLFSEEVSTLKLSELVLSKEVDVQLMPAVKRRKVCTFQSIDIPAGFYNHGFQVLPKEKTINHGLRKNYWHLVADAFSYRNPEIRNAHVEEACRIAREEYELQENRIWFVADLTRRFDDEDFPCPTIYFSAKCQRHFGNLKEALPEEERPFWVNIAAGNHKKEFVCMKTTNGHYVDIQWECRHYTEENMALAFVWTSTRIAEVVITENRANVVANPVTLLGESKRNN